MGYENFTGFANPTENNAENSIRANAELQIGAKNFIERVERASGATELPGTEDVLQQYKDLQNIAEKRGDGLLVKKFFDDHPNFSGGPELVGAILDEIRSNSNSKTLH